ncbi:hypothetical protein MCO_00168 [Bartonella sp. DB5-6]|nr:hypothetical protein MCO_00168 [Bartonella sp. DB5-6]
MFWYSKRSLYSSDWVSILGGHMSISRYLSYLCHDYFLMIEAHLESFFITIIIPQKMQTLLQTLHSNIK